MVSNVTVSNVTFFLSKKGTIDALKIQLLEYQSNRYDWVIILHAFVLYLLLNRFKTMLLSRGK